MKTALRSALAAAGLLVATQAAAEITFYEREAYGGRSFTTADSMRNLNRADFGDRASSIVVARDRWEVCEFPRFEGRCVLLRPGSYPSLSAMGMNNAISSVRNIDRDGPGPAARTAPPPVAVYTPPPAAIAQAGTIVFYEREGFGGRSYVAERSIANLDRFDFGDRASSIVVQRDRWEVCELPRFEGRCVLLRPGNYPSLASIGLNNAISSVRNVDRDGRGPSAGYTPPAYVAPAPAYPAPAYDYRRRPNEALYEAPVTSVRAVVGTAEQRCWVEREQVVDRGSANVPGAVAGALIGGILGHQVGRGSGRDVATVGGAVAGAAIGSNIDRGPGGVYAQDVQRCSTTPSARPSYYDVTYSFSGRDYRVQLANPPGPTVTVNANGEPRG
jgi:uncharacterized protein YcfJ